MNKDNLKIVFLGTPDFAVESLRRLVEGGYNIAAVVTMPDKKAGRGHKMFQSPVKEYAVSHGLEVLQPERLKDPDFVNRLKEIDADLFIVIAFRMLPEVVWNMPRLGTFNLHASLLPDYRGAAPINHAVMNGEKTTGVTTFMLKHEIDTGDILQQESIEIGPDENVGSVHDRLMMLGADLTIRTVDEIIAGTLVPVPQAALLENRCEPKAAPKIFKDTCFIDWRLPASSVHNFVRGLSPYPAAWCILKGANSPEVEIKIMEVRSLEKQLALAPGEVDIRDGHMYVGCGEGCVEILQLRPAGKKQMDAASYLRGARLVDPQMLLSQNI